MTDDDDEALGGIDLSAWEVPPVAATLGEAVVTRMREPVGAAALEGVERGTRRRWWLAGGALALGAALAGVVWATSGDATARDGSGTLATAKPSHLELGASAVELDANTELRWTREGDHLVATQPRGTATWKVGEHDRLVIDAGATVASVEATGASLRVEVQMNLSEVRSVGASAVTAAAVAMVTVMVYEGHVNVTSAGETVRIAAGDTVEVLAGKPPIERIAVAGDPADIRRLRAELDASKQRILELDHQLEALGAGRPGVTVPATACDFDALRAAGDDHMNAGEHAAALASYEAALGCKRDPIVLVKTFVAACNARAATKARLYFPQLPADRQPALSQACLRFGIDPKSAPVAAGGDPELDRARITAGISKAKDQVRACGDGTAGVIKAKVTVGVDGTVTAVTATPAGAVATCVEQRLKAATFGRTSHGGSFSYPFVFERGTQATTPAQPPAPCDFAQLVREGDDQVTRGGHAAALNAYEHALQCRMDNQVLSKAFVAACNSRNVVKAKQLFPRLPPQRQQMLSQACLRFGIDPHP
jgi:hypothetical protein